VLPWGVGRGGAPGGLATKAIPQFTPRPGSVAPEDVPSRLTPQASHPGLCLSVPRKRVVLRDFLGAAGEE